MPRRSSLHPGWVVGLLLAVPAIAQEPADATAPADTAAATVERWLGALSKATPGESGMAELVTAVAATHDVPAITADAVGSSWEKVDAALRERLLAAFPPYLAARELACVGGIGATFGAPKPSEEAGTTVFSTTATSSEGEVPVQVRVQDGEHGWRITAVTVDGHSLAAAFHSELAPALAADDFERVLADLEQQTALFGASASAVIQRLQAALLTAMKDADKMHYAGRYRLLAPVVTATHDLPFIARFVLRQQWKDLDEDQRQRFTDAFRELSLSSYAARFDGWSGETFEVTGEQKLRGDYRLVKSKLNRPEDEPIQFDYMLHREDCRWQIVNILVDGVSDLATKQTEYKSIVDSDGFDALVAKIEQQIDKYRTESED